MKIISNKQQSTSQNTAENSRTRFICQRKIKNIDIPDGGNLDKNTLDGQEHILLLI